jgi:chromosomal replication initiator protein
VVDGLLSIPFLGRTSRSDAAQRPAQDEAGLPEFLLGPENGLVGVAVRALLEQTAPEYNPFFFHGPSGCGKSHLAWGLAAAWRRAFPRCPALCTPAWEFSQELADAIDAQTTEDFRAAYRRAALLVMEDLERLADRPFAQEELADALDVLRAAGGWVVLTASAAPQALAGISPRLRSRLVGGLSAPVSLPAPDTRLAILRRLAELRKIELPDAVARLVADAIGGGVPELSGALAHLGFSAEADGSPLTPQRARHYLAQRHASREPSLRAIASATARLFSLRSTQLLSSSRSRAVVTARNIAMYLARNLTKQSFQQIGRYFGGRDHTTVSYGCRKTEQLLESEPALRQTVSRLQRHVLHQA